MRSCSCLGIVIALGVSACGRANGEAPRFSGKLGQGRVDPAAIDEAPQKPAGFVTLGHVTVRYRSDEGVRTLHDESLGDVDCSEALLVAGLRDKAAEVGGRLLVGRECRSDDQPRGDLWKSTLITCEAEVASPNVPGATYVPAESVVTSADPVTGDHAELEYRSPTLAYEVKVTFDAVDPNGPQRAPRPSDAVSELAVLPPSDVVMGDIVARCRKNCERSAVRYAVRAAAARVGASDVVGIACIRAHSGFLCTGRAARPEADPATNLLAR